MNQLCLLGRGRLEWRDIPDPTIQNRSLGGSSSLALASAILAGLRLWAPSR